MKTHLTEPVRYQTEFAVGVHYQQGSKVCIRKHLEELPGLIWLTDPEGLDYFLLTIEADDKHHAVWKVRHHLQPVCGVLNVRG